MHNQIILRKSGLFYETFDEDAKILHYLFGYKMINDRVAFPDNALNKIINGLEEKKISYEIKSKDNSEKMDFKDKNSYQKMLMKSQNKIAMAKLVNKLILKLEKMDDEKLYAILRKLEEYVNEE